MADSSDVNFPIIDGFMVDLLALLSIDYACDPALCKDTVSCCASYDVCISESDVIKIIPHFPQASIFAPAIKEGDDYGNLFDETEDGLFSLETNEDLQCKLAWKNDSGELLCSLHSHALKNNLSFYDTKPKSCCLWPLAESDSKPKCISIDSDSLKFPCVTKKTTQDYKLNKELSLIIEKIYGSDFLEKVNLSINLLK